MKWIGFLLISVNAAFVIFNISALSMASDTALANRSLWQTVATKRNRNHP
jgi:hypothetical protein